jgi:hypothetical protein
MSDPGRIAHQWLASLLAVNGAVEFFPAGLGPPAGPGVSAAHGPVE